MSFDLSKKNNSRLLNYSFLILILTIGFPFQSFSDSYGIPTNITIGSDNQIVNFFLGNGFVGKSIFDPSTYGLLEEIILEEKIKPAFAQETNATYPMVTRMENHLDTQLTDTRHIVRLGMPTHIEDNQGDWVANLYNEDDEGVQLESGSLSYYFDKSACAMSLFDTGRISDTSVTVIKSNNWVTKVALNGTDNWSDVSQNFLPCTITTQISGNSIIINSTKSDVNGTMTEIYHYSKYSGMKETVYFTNNDPALNDHKFSFSNIIQDVPPSLLWTSSDPVNILKTNMYSQYESQFQPVIFGGNATFIPITNTTSTIQIDKSDFLWNDNGTDMQINDKFAWIQLTEEDGRSSYRIWEYTFSNEEDFEKLWAIKFVTNPDFTMDTYIDFANVTSILPLGNTTSIDPTINTFESFIRMGLGSNTVNCNRSSGGFSESTQLGMSINSGSAIQKSCSLPMVTFDITPIPADATPIRGTLTMDVLSSSCSGGVLDWCTEIQANRFISWFDCSGEDLRFLPLVDKINAFFKSDLCKNPALFNTGKVVGGTQSQTQTDVSFDPFLIEFEKTLEKIPRDNVYILGASVSGVGSDTDNFGLGFTYSTQERNGQANSQWNATNSFLEIEFDQFTPPFAPQNAVCSQATPTTVLVDWTAVLDDGGRPVTEYQIERDSGAGFVSFQVGLPLFPTDFIDTTVFAGVGFKYRIAALNGEGLGEFSTETQQCGVEGDPDNPFNLVAQNVIIGTVGLNWQEPDFTGNSPITGYKIERTTGTPTGITNDWECVIHKTDGTFPPAHGISHNDENVVMSHGATNNSRGEIIFFKTFDILDIEARSLNVLSQHANTNTQISYNIRMFDGTYTADEVNESGGDFPLQAGIVSKGAGLLQSFSTNVPFSETIQGFVIDTSGATFDGTVTIMIIHLDANASTNAGSTQINSIEIEGYATWDFGDLVITVGVPVKSVKTVDTLFVVAPIGSEQSGDITVQAPNGIIFGDGFIALVEDTANLFLEFLDDTVEELTLYGYRVIAINVVGTSLPSNIATVTTVSSPQPPIITATPTSTSSINIDWETPDLGGGVLAFYEIERKQGQAGIFQFLDTTTDTFFDDGTGLFALQSATEFCYRVKTLTNVGNSIFSFESCATTFAPPDKVENLVVIAIDGSSVNMSFDDPLSDGGSPLTGFQIEQKIGAGAFNIVQQSDSFNKIRNDTGLPIGTLITYRVESFNQFGGGNQASASDTTDATPQTPPNFTCSASSTTSITLNWDTPETFTAPTGYQIDGRSIGGSFSTIEADTASTDTFFVSGGLPVDTTIQFRILGHTPEGDTDFTPTITCSTLGAPDFPPEDLQGDFTQTIPHQMVLAWDIPDTFGVPITEFRIERNDGAGYNEIASVSGSTFLFIDQDPANNVEQKYRIFTVGSEGDSAPSIAIPFSANQTSHWHYEKTVDDTGGNKNVGAVTGTVNFNNTGQVGLGHLFDGSTYITVDNESDYDHSNNVSFGITTYYRGNSTGVDQVLVSKAGTMSDIGFRMFIDSTGVLGVRLTNTVTSNELHVLGSTNVTNNSIHFLGFGYDGNDDESGLSLMVDGSFETKNVITNTLSSGILNARPLVLGANDGGGNKLTGLLDETRFFGSGTLDDETLQAIAEDSITTVIPINATITIAGATFADISRETPLIIMTSGYPLPTVNTIDLFNFTATNVNSQAVGLVIDGVSGQFILDPSLFNIMGSLSNYTAISSLTNSEETFPLLSNFDIQVPIFTFTGDFFFQQQRNPTFDILSFNYTQTIIPFDLDCNFKSTLFGNGTTVEFDGVFFVQLLQPVSVLEDVVVACIDPNQPIVDPLAPSFGGINTILSFVSFGDTTGVGNFLQFTQNYGDFFGVGLPFLFVIILAAAFTGRSAPTGILIIAIAIGIMWAMGILTIDPFMWGIILVLVILGLLGGKKFL